jgi:signal transduction histidine kinase
MSLKPIVNAPSLQEKMQEQEFQVLDLAFLGSLLPGIIHNLATPLSGVLGATQLLEKRASTMEELVEGLESLTEAERSELNSQFTRTRTNVDILSRNAKHLADVLQIIVHRINRGNGSTREFFSLNELIQNELRFLDANLTFKHKVKKTITLGPDLPAAKAVYGHVASVLDEFVSGTVALHNFSQGIMTMEFVTGATDRHVTLDIAAPVIRLENSVEATEPLDFYLQRLRGDSWLAQVQSDPELRRLALACPRRDAVP